MPINDLTPGFYPLGSVLLGTDGKGTHALECVEADSDRPCRGCFFADYPGVCDRMLCAPGGRPDKTAVFFRELQDNNITNMRYRITGFRVWRGGHEIASEELGRSPYMTPAQLTAERQKIINRYAAQIAQELYVDFSLKPEEKGESDAEADD